MTDILRAPYPYFGGKRRAAKLVWEALGNVEHYIEPFCGSAAVLLARPHVGRCETINDADSMVTNFWRSVAADPATTAKYASFPVVETELHARHRWLIGQRENLTEKLIDDVNYFDAKIAGWWVWGACAWLAGGWCEKERRGLPNLGHEGRGLLAPMRGGALADDAVSFTSPAEWLTALSSRLRKVRVATGDWSRILGPSVLVPPSMPVRAVCGIYFDPPYSEGKMQYSAGGTGTSLSAEVRSWCEDHARDPSVRIALSGYDGEHNALESNGWRVASWKSKGGYSSQGGENANQKRERIWFSPNCMGGKQGALNFGAKL